MRTRRDFLRAGLFGVAGLALCDLVGRAQPVKARRPMRIKRIDRTTVQVPYRETPGRNMARELPYWGYHEIVEVELHSGHVGHGETMIYYTWGVTSDDAVKRSLDQNAVALMWDDSLGAGLQMALFDAVARANDVPVHALLGRKVHDTTPLAWWNIDTSPEDLASECKEAYRQGYRSYKSKGRPWFDVWAMADAAKDAVPEDFEIALDFNDTLLDAERGIPILKELAGTPQMAKWESPIPQGDIPGNQAIRAATPDVPLAMHYGNPNPLVAVREKVCDGWVVGGGASRLMHTGAFAELAGLPFWLQLVGTGLTAAYSMQFGAVLKQATWPAVNCHQLFTHQMLAEPIELTDGYAEVPDSPGLGFEIDRDAVEKFRVETPASRPEPPRLIETTWKDGKRMLLANNGQVNFMLTLAMRGGMPYFERGVTTRLIPDDGSDRWKELYAKARQGPVFDED